MRNWGAEDLRKASVRDIYERKGLIYTQSAYFHCWCVAGYSDVVMEEVERDGRRKNRRGPKFKITSAGKGRSGRKERESGCRAMRRPGEKN